MRNKMRRRIAEQHRQLSLTNNKEQSFVERVNRLSLFFSFFPVWTLGDGVRGSIIYIDLVFRDE